MDLVVIVFNVFPHNNGILRLLQSLLQLAFFVVIFSGYVTLIKKSKV